MDTRIVNIVDGLPQSSLTVSILHALDFVAPGEYHNLTGFANTIKVLTGEDDEAMVKKIGERAVVLFNDKTQGYQRALWLYQTVDTLQSWMGAAALANKVGEKYNLLSFLSKVTPKSEKTQVFDLGVKLVTEVVGFCSLNGLPGDSLGDFVKAITNYREEAAIRMAALVCLDGMLPLGPDFLSKVLSMLQSSGGGDLAQSERFQKVEGMIPGDGPTGKLAFIRQSVGSVGDWMRSFVADRHVTVDKVAGSLKKYVDIAEDKLDYVAAVLDMTTNYFEHTGTQSVARSLILRAVAEV